MLKRALVLVLLGPVLALAQAAEPAGKLTNEAIIKRTVESRLGGVKVEAVAKTPYLGLYEVRLDGEILYTDEKINYIFSGNIIDAKSMQNITEKRLRDLTAIKWENLPLDAAVKTVRGNGKRTLAVFSDPNCPYCKRFEKDLAKVDDVTIYVLLYPIPSLHPQATDRSKAIWCAKDRGKAWDEALHSGVVPTGTASCETPIAQLADFAQRHRISGTPTIFLSDGRRVVGSVPKAELEQQMLRAGQSK